MKMNDRPEPPFKRTKQPETEVKIDLYGISSEVAKMGDSLEMPKLPFEKILSYLSLEDRIRCRRVSKSWHKMINGDQDFKVKSLFYSSQRCGSILGKSRWVRGAFAQNAVSSPGFGSFFRTFNESILSNLKHLRLCDLHLNEENGTAFAQTLNSLGQLKELNIVRLNYHVRSNSNDLVLSLPMLNSIHLEEVNGIEKLTLDTPRLQNVRIWVHYLKLNLVHGQSVQRLAINGINYNYNEVQKLENLKHLYIGPRSRIDLTFLFGLKQLKQIHLFDQGAASNLFKQKEQNSRADLKIYLFGCHLNGPDNRAIDSLPHCFGDNNFVRLAENPSELADEIPFYECLNYHAIERVAPGSELNVLARFSDLYEIRINEPVQDIERFLVFLKNFEHIVDLHFSCGQPQDLFDRLPDHCAALQNLTILKEPPDFRFLPRLTHLLHLYLFCSIDAELVRKLLEELKFLSFIRFKCLNKLVTIRIPTEPPKRFEVAVKFVVQMQVSDVNSAIQLIIEKTKKKTRRKKKT